MISPQTNKFARESPTHLSQSIPQQNYPPQGPPQNYPHLQSMTTPKKIYESSPQLQKRSSSMNRVIMTDGERKINILSSRVSEYSNELHHSRSLLREKEKLIGSYERDINSGKGVI